MRASTESTRAAAEDREEAFDAEWRPIEARLNLRDPRGALDQLAQVRKGMRNAMHHRTEDWFTRHMSLPPNEQARWYDEQGLYRLIYMVWPDLPVRMFSLEMIPTLFGAMGRYDTEFRKPAEAAHRRMVERDRIS